MGMSRKSAINLVASNNYISYNKLIAKKFGLEATIVFGELCSISNIFNDQEFYCLKTQIEEDTCLSSEAVRKALKFLEQCGAITITKKGIPCRNYYTINIDTVLEILDDENWTKSSKSTEVKKEVKNDVSEEDFNVNEVEEKVSSDMDFHTSSGVENNTSSGVDFHTTRDTDFHTTINKTINKTITQTINKTITIPQSQNSDDSSATNQPTLDETLAEINNQSSSSLINSLDNQSDNLTDDTKQQTKIIKVSSPPSSPKAKGKKTIKTYPASDYEIIKKEYESNYRLLLSQKKINKPLPVIAIASMRATLKTAFDNYGFDNVLKAVKASANDEWLINNGYMFFHIFGQKKLPMLINGLSFSTTNTVAKNKSAIDSMYQGIDTTKYNDQKSWSW